MKTNPVKLVALATKRAANTRARIAALFISIFAFSGLLSHPSWAQIVGTSALNVERRGHSATLLEHGNVLIAGGENQSGLVSQAEIFDATSRVSSLASSLLTARTDHTATKLEDGRVLVIGGRDQSGQLTSTEIYDPATGLFTPGPSLVHPRAGHTATVLYDGKILVAGGDLSVTAELYTPSTDSFTLVTGSLNVARQFHSAVLLKDGKVLIVGGVAADNTVLNSAEIYYSANQSFYPTDNLMLAARGLAVLRVLPDGKVQVIGGDSDLSMEVFDPTIEQFNAKALLPPNADLLTATLSTHSRAALFSHSVSEDPLLQPVLTPEQLALLDRADHTITEIPQSNEVLVAGGLNSSGEVLSSATLVKSSSATITTDKTDYAPGQIVTITGSGFQSNEQVAILFHEFPEEYPDIFLQAVANQQGNFVVAEFAPQQIDIGRIFTVTAIGQSSGLTAQTAFKDDQVVNSIDTTIDGTLETVTITAGGPAASVGFFIQPSNTPSDDANGCNSTGANPATITLSVPTAVNASATSLTFTGCGTGTSQGVMFSSNTPGSYTISIASVAGGKAGSKWDTTPASFTLVVNPPADSTAPTISCTVPNQTVWYGTNVTVSCTASDSDSGLANPSDASFSLTTSVMAGTETASASTNTKTVCDNNSNCAVVGPYSFKVDKKAPQQITCDSPDGLWHNDNVTLHCTYTDGGSGPAIQQVNLITNVAAGTEVANALASANGAQACDMVDNCAASPADIPGNMIDRKAPTVSCGAADTDWHATDQSFTCSVTDGGSGPASQTISLSTNVAAGTEMSNASTNSQQVCDAVNNCATVGPVSGFKIDKKAPQQASCDTPDGVWHGADVTLHCTYTDGGSGPASQQVALSTNVGAGTETINAVASANGTQACDAVGNCAVSPADIAGNKIDKKAPQQTSCDASDGLWHNDNVTLHCTYTDGGSGPASQQLGLITNVPAGSETANASASANGDQACDKVGNCAPSPADIAGNMIDRKAPAVSCGSADLAWHATDQSVTCSSTDGGSGPATQSVTLTTNVAAGTETATASTNSQPICDAVNNCATAGPVGGFKIDKKSPQQASCDAPDGAWHGSDVTLHCTYTDGGSGPASQQISLTTIVAAGAETSNAVASATGAQACDAVGNCAASPADIAGNKIDKKAPIVSCGSADTAWHATDQSVTCRGTDGGSGPAIQTVNLSTNVAASTETANASTNSLPVCDAVNNCATAGPISPFKVDKKAPTNITFVGSISNGGSYYFGFVPPAPTCTATDGGSGLQSCIVAGYGTSVGSHTLTATATDNVGNTSTAALSYTVLAWTLYGFYQPVDMSNSPIVWNTVKGGSTVPLKFEVAAGATELTVTSVVKSLSAYTVACTNGAEDTLEELSATGGTSLRYDTTGGQFIYNWQTPKKPGVCYKATMTTQDGSSLSAYFNLK